MLPGIMRQLFEGDPAKAEAAHCRRARSPNVSTTSTCSRSRASARARAHQASRRDPGPGAARRRDAVGDLAGAVADRDRVDLLPRDHRVLAGVRARSRARVDGGARTLVRAATAAVGFAGSVHGASCRADGAGRRVERRDRRGAPRRATPVAEERSRSRSRRAVPAGRINRLRGELAQAEEVYAAASRAGREPLPGLALLRLAQGKTDAAASAMRRIVTTTREGLQRARYLPAHVEIMLAAGNLAQARAARDELQAIAARFETEVLRAMAAQAHAARAARRRRRMRRHRAAARGDADLAARRRAVSGRAPARAARPRVSRARRRGRRAAAVGARHATRLPRSAPSRISSCSRSCRRKLRVRPASVPRRTHAPRSMACPRASSRCCACSRPARPTA